MSQYKYAEIADTVYFWFAANETTGTAGDGASPLYDVRLAGAAVDAAPTASGTPSLLTHANYSPGLFEIAIDTTGYAAGEYAVFCTLTISTVNPAGFCGSFKLRTAGTGALDVNTTHVGGTAQTAGDIPDILSDATNGLTAINTNVLAIPTTTGATPAEVNAEILDVLETDTFAELAAVPAATSSLKDKIVWLFMQSRNKMTQTSTTTTLRNDADGADVSTSTVSKVAGTVTRGEWS